jgi:hypothetical protein
VNEPAHSLVLAFDSDQREFARGFEAGALWEALRSDAAELQATVHASNTEMVVRMGEALGRQVEGDQVDADWTSVRFSAPAVDAVDPSPRIDGQEP